MPSSKWGHEKRSRTNLHFPPTWSGYTLYGVIELAYILIQKSLEFRNVIWIIKISTVSDLHHRENGNYV